MKHEIGARVNVTSLRDGKTYPGTVTKVIEAERAYVVQLDGHNAVRVGAGFVSPLTEEDS